MFPTRSLITKTSKSGELSTYNLSNNLQFWLLLIFGVSSLICSLFMIYSYLSSRTLRNALHNHAILLIIIINVILIVTDVSWMLDSLRNSGRAPLSTSSFCLTWWFIDDGLYSVQTGILAWASIERHILIFHSKYVVTKKQKIFYHYLPPLIILIYLLSFQASILIFPPCKHHFNFNEPECGSNPCYLSNYFLAIWDVVANNVFPTFIIAIFNIALFYRIIAQKKRLRQPIQWRKHRRMSIQLLSISAVYLFLNLPMTVIALVQTIHNTNPEVGFGTQLYIFFTSYSVTLSLPFVVCLNYLSLDKNRHIRISPTLTIVQHKKIFAREITTIE
jgi:hypothetical protein